MSDTTSTPRPVSVQPATGDKFTDLVRRSAAGDRNAFRRLYADLAAPTWRAAAAWLGCSDAASSVTDATFMEVWYRATSFDAAVRGGGEWIASIAARRCEDWLRAANLAGGRGLTDSMAYYSRHLRSELAAILMVGNPPKSFRYQAPQAVEGRSRKSNGTRGEVGQATQANRSRPTHGSR